MPLDLEAFLGLKEKIVFLISLMKGAGWREKVNKIDRIDGTLSGWVVLAFEGGAKMFRSEVILI